jgi:hypothetical protein
MEDCKKRAGIVHERSQTSNLSNLKSYANPKIQLYPQTNHVLIPQIDIDILVNDIIARLSGTEQFILVLTTELDHVCAMLALISRGPTGTERIKHEFYLTSRCNLENTLKKVSDEHTMLKVQLNDLLN